MEAVIIIAVLALLGVIYYQIQNRIGEEQAREWVEYKKEHPELFAPPVPLTTPSSPSKDRAALMKTEEAKFVREMWARHDTQRSASKSQ